MDTSEGCTGARGVVERERWGAVGGSVASSHAAAALEASFWLGVVGTGEEQGDVFSARLVLDEKTEEKRKEREERSGRECMHSKEWPTWV